MASHILDSRVLRDLYGTPEMRAVFDDLSVMQSWLDVEVALAQAEAEIGIIPMYASDEISRRARGETLDIVRIKLLVDQTVHPIVPLIRVLQEACDGDAGEYIHWGATTQDITDTGMVLQIKQAIGIFEVRLSALTDVLLALARRYRDTPMAGRTHGQQALPITFGFKVSVWFSEVQRHRERLAQCKARVLVGQFGGAVGTLASVARHGLEIQTGMMARLGLQKPSLPWHTARDTIAEFCATVSIISATMGKIALEIINLQRTEVGEVEEPFYLGKVGSSTMPHKRNPMICEAAVAVARLVTRNVPVALDAMIQTHERDWVADHLEWAVVPEICIMGDGAIYLTTRVLDGLQVYPEQMQRNLDRLGGLMLSEAVMLALAPTIGRQAAHDVIYKCSMEAIENKADFKKTLVAHPIVSKHLSGDEVEKLLDPAQYTGLAAYLCRSSPFISGVTGEYLSWLFRSSACRTPSGKCRSSANLRRQFATCFNKDEFVDPFTRALGRKPPQWVLAGRCAKMITLHAPIADTGMH